MRTLIDLFVALLKASGAIVGMLFSAFGFGVLCFFGYGFMTYRLNLFETPPLLIGAGLAWLGVWLGTVLSKTGKPAKAMAAFCVIALTGISFARLLPGTTEGGKTYATYADKQALELAKQSVVEVIRPFECNSTNADAISYFGRDGVTGEKITLINYAFDTKSGRVLCFREKGVYDKTGESVKAVTLDIIDRIAKQGPLEGPKPIPTPELVQVAVAPPVPITVPAVVVTPAVPPTPEPVPVVPVHTEPQEYATERGQTLTVALTEPLDLGERGENHQFKGVLVRDITDPNGIVLAKAGTAVGMIICNLQLDPRTNAALLEIEVTSLTTTNGTSLPVRAHHDGMIPVSPVRIGIKKG